MTASLRVATLNIWNRFGDWPARRAVLRDQLAALAPDLIGLQEVVFEQSLSNPQLVAGGQAHEIADGLGYHLAHASAMTLGDDEPAGVRYAFGNALLSKYPILDAETIPLPLGPDDSERRSVLRATVSLGDQEQGVYVTHLNYRLDECWVRINQARALVEIITRHEPLVSTRRPALLLGDFNAEPDSDEMRYLTGRGSVAGASTYFLDVWRHANTVADRAPAGHTYDPVNPLAAVMGEHARRIDYILVRGGPDEAGRGRPLGVSLAFDTPRAGEEGPVYASDHFGVIADLTR